VKRVAMTRRKRRESGGGSFFWRDLITDYAEFFARKQKGRHLQCRPFNPASSNEQENNT
jgi:hypothetical protein